MMVEARDRRGNTAAVAGIDSGFVRLTLTDGTVYRLTERSGALEISVTSALNGVSVSTLGPTIAVSPA